MIEGEEEEVSESTDIFLAALGKTFLDNEDADIELAEILTTHLLTTSPAADAVVQAKAAILKLVSDRAQPPESEADNG